LFPVSIERETTHFGDILEIGTGQIEDILAPAKPHYFQQFKTNSIEVGVSLAYTSRG
jgi:hypothetical protein